MAHETANMAVAYLSQMGSTVASKCLLEHMTALKLLSYRFVTASLRLIAEVLGLGLYERLLAAFGETGWFGGLATFSCPQEGRENRAVTEGKFFHFPR
jgi:hypothetical protein